MDDALFAGRGGARDEDGGAGGVGADGSDGFEEGGIAFFEEFGLLSESAIWMDTSMDGMWGVSRRGRECGNAAYIAR